MASDARQTQKEDMNSVFMYLLKKYYKTGLSPKVTRKHSYAQSANIQYYHRQKSAYYTVKSFCKDIVYKKAEHVNISMNNYLRVKRPLETKSSKLNLTTF